MEARKEEERKFHDELRRNIDLQRWEEGTEPGELSWSNMKYYSIERTSRQVVLDWIKERSLGRRVLDYCCGNGEDAIFAAKHGAEAYGIDISEISISNCRKKAVAVGVGNNTVFEVMDAEALQFPDNFFDTVVVYGVLHHLDYEKALSELSRVLKPTGQIICTEALKHNPFIHLYRRLTPHLRTAWETDHILTKHHLAVAHQFFDSVDANLFHLATLGAVPFRKSALFDPILGCLETVDKALLKIPGIKWWAWQVIFILSRPKSTSPAFLKTF